MFATIWTRYTLEEGLTKSPVGQTDRVKNVYRFFFKWIIIRSWHCIACRVMWVSVNASGMRCTGCPGGGDVMFVLTSFTPACPVGTTLVASLPRMIVNTSVPPPAMAGQPPQPDTALSIGTAALNTQLPRPQIVSPPCLCPPATAHYSAGHVIDYWKAASKVTGYSFSFLFFKTFLVFILQNYVGCLFVCLFKYRNSELLSLKLSK